MANQFYEYAMAKAKIQMEIEKQLQSQSITMQGMPSGVVRDDTEEIQVIYCAYYMIQLIDCTLRP